MGVKYEWHEPKRLSNIEHHGINFESATEFDWESALVYEDTRRDYGESRYIAYGKLSGRLTVMVFSLRNDTIRIISLRKANNREVTRYETRIQN